MTKILQTIQVIQDMQIIHRNLIPENIYVKHTSEITEIKLAEFGFSCTFNPNDQSIWNIDRNICSKCGTPGYIAPEIFANKRPTYSCDIYSLGVILYAWYIAFEF